MIARRYTVVSRLGSGGFSNVYLGRDQHQSTLVALKVIPLSHHPEAVVDYFHREAEVLRNLCDGGLPSVYNFLSSPQQVVLVLEWVPGTNLKQYLLQNTTTEPVRILRWSLEVLRILAYLHRQKPYPILMGDLKPSNIIVTYDERIKIIDFGVAQPYGAVNDNPHKIALISPGFSPPEQATKGGLQPQSDLYSFGATLLWCLTGFDASRSLQGMTALQERLGLPSLPLVRLLRQCLALQPQERPPSVQYIDQEIRSCLQSMESIQSKSSDLLAQLYKNKGKGVL